MFGVSAVGLRQKQNLLLDWGFFYFIVLVFEFNGKMMYLKLKGVQNSGNGCKHKKEQS